MKTMKPHFFIIFFAVLFLLSSCNTQKIEEVTFAVTPIYSNTEMFKQMDPLVKFLSEDTGIIFRQLYPKDISEFIEKAKNEEYDFCYSNPTSYVQFSLKKGERTKGHNAFAMAQMEGKLTYHGEILTRKDNSKIKSLEDLKSRKGMIVSKSSLGGFLSQYAFLKKNQIDITKDATIIAAPDNKQEKVVIAVYNQEVDFGFVREGARDKVKDKIDLNEISVLSVTDEFPQWIFSASTKMPKNVLQKVLASLLKASGSTLEKAKIDKFFASNDEALNIIRSTYDELGEKY